MDRSTLHVPLSKRDPQGVGSAITYGCRYALMATLGLPPVDDDGESAMDRSSPPTQASRPAPVTSGRQQASAPLSEAYRGFLRVMKLSRSKADLRDWWDENKASIAQHLPENESLLLVGERNTLGATLPEFTEEAA